MIEHGIKSGKTIKLILNQFHIKGKNNNCVLVFPSSKVSVNTKFTVYYRLLRLVHDQLKNKEPISKRQLFYMDVKLFQKQSVVDSAIDVIANSINIPMEQLNIYASQKGLVFGNFSLQSLEYGDHYIRCVSDSVLIPPIPTFTSAGDFNLVFNDNIDYPDKIIILEKDAILFALVEKDKTLKDHERLFKNSILITGRGFPDRLTKHFVHIISTRVKHNTPVYGFFDADIYGFLIALEYKIKVNKQIKQPCCPYLQMKGCLLFPKCKDNQIKLDFLPLSKNDFKMTISQFNTLSNVGFDPSIKDSITELQRSLFLFIKRELQAHDILDML